MTLAASWSGVRRAATVGLVVVGLLARPGTALCLPEDLTGSASGSLYPHGFADVSEFEQSPDGNAEVLADFNNSLGHWFASSLTEVTNGNGNLEVGVDFSVGFLRGDGFAEAALRVDKPYAYGNPDGAVTFTFQPGRILFRTQSENLAPNVGTHEGTLRTRIAAFLNSNLVAEFNWYLTVVSTQGGFEVGDASTSNALDSLDHFYEGEGAVWGVTTHPIDVVLIVPAIEAGDLLQVVYSMAASGVVSGYGDAGLGIEAKIGDPFGLPPEGGLGLPDDVPEPPVFESLALAMIAALRLRGRRTLAT